MASPVPRPVLPVIVRVDCELQPGTLRSWPHCQGNVAPFHPCGWLFARVPSL